VVTAATPQLLGGTVIETDCRVCSPEEENPFEERIGFDTGYGGILAIQAEMAVDMGCRFSKVAQTDLPSDTQGARIPGQRTLMYLALPDLGVQYQKLVAFVPDEWEIDEDLRIIGGHGLLVRLRSCLVVNNHRIPFRRQNPSKVVARRIKERTAWGDPVSVELVQTDFSDIRIRAGRPRKCSW
jgi:hypothetical protein